MKLDIAMCYGGKEQAGALRDICCKVLCKETRRDMDLDIIGR